MHCADAIPWMRARIAGDGPLPATSAVTSLPDVSEVNMTLPAWRAWFLDAVQLVVACVPDNGAALFFQTDIKVDGRWIDKGALVVRAVEDAGAHLLFHKVVCRRQPGQMTFGRPGYTHLVAASRALRCPDLTGLPDVIVDAGRLTWVRAMGVRAAAQAVAFARDHAGARCIFDPFCGVGTTLAVANTLGLDGLGVEKSRKRAERARTLQVPARELAA